MSDPVRSRIPILLLVEALAIVVPPPARAAAAPVRLVPEPAHLEQRSGVARIGPGWTVIPANNSAAACADAGVLIEEIARRSGTHLALGRRRAGRPAIEIRTMAVPDDAPAAFRTEGYELEIRPTRIEIRAPSAAGRWYGIQTLRQLVRGSLDGSVPCLLVRDRPAMRWRGVSDDVSRGQMSTPANFERIIERLAYFKLNLYQPYIEDAFEFERHPEIGRGRARLTGPELRRLVEFGRRHHVVVAPIFETLGHQARMLSEPSLRRYSEQCTEADLPWSAATAPSKLAAFARGLVFGVPDEAAPAASFSPVQPETRAFVDSLIAELAEAGTLDWIHLGGDEAADIGTGTSRALAGRIGAARVKTRYLCALARDAARPGRHVMLYADAFRDDPAEARALPAGSLLVEWQYSPVETTLDVARLRAAGGADVIVGAGMWNWRAFYPDFGRAMDNLDWLARAGREQGAVGLVVASWGDGGAESPREANWPGYAYAAAAAWQARPVERASQALGYVRVTHGIESAALARAYRLVGEQSFESLGWNGRLYHMPPRLHARSAPWLERMHRLADDMRQARTALATSAPRARFELEGVEILDHAARRFAYAARRELVLDTLAGPRGGTGGTGGQASQSGSLARLDSLAGAADTLASQYRWLWRRDNRPAGLVVPWLRMTAQSDALLALRSELQAGRGLAAESPDSAGRPAAPAGDFAGARLVPARAASAGSWRAR